jgi:hypothetical protein
MKLTVLTCRNRRSIGSLDITQPIDFLIRRSTVNPSQNELFIGGYKLVYHFLRSYDSSALIPPLRLLRSLPIARSAANIHYIIDGLKNLDQGWGNFGVLYCLPRDLVDIDNDWD